MSKDIYIFSRPFTREVVQSDHGGSAHYASPEDDLDIVLSKQGNCSRINPSPIPPEREICQIYDWVEQSVAAKIYLTREGSDEYMRRVRVEVMPEGKEFPAELLNLLEKEGYRGGRLAA
jgi:hypothetical protein